MAKIIEQSDKTTILCTHLSDEVIKLLRQQQYSTRGARVVVVPGEGQTTITITGGRLAGRRLTAAKIQDLLAQEIWSRNIATAEEVVTPDVQETPEMACLTVEDPTPESQVTVPLTIPEASNEPGAQKVAQVPEPEHLLVRLEAGSGCDITALVPRWVALQLASSLVKHAVK